MEIAQFGWQTMQTITTEQEWLACQDPQHLAYFLRGRVDTQRFRWLAVDWGSRIRHIFEPEDLLWFDAFASYVAGEGPHPAEICPQDIWRPLDRPLHDLAYARFCADAIRSEDSLRAAADAATSTSEHYPSAPLPKPDYTRTHRGRANDKRNGYEAESRAHHEAWYLAKAAHAKRVLRCFCDEFRDVAGNPFRNVSIEPEWQSSCVLELVQAIHNDSSWHRLPQLAEALLDSGCDESQILEHCLEPSVHVRGCWVIESLRQKSNIM